MRLLRGRWFWGIVGAIATTYLIQRSRRQNSRRGMNGTGRALRSVARAGRSVVDQTVKAALRRS